MIQTAFMPPDVSWSRKRSLKMVSSSQNQITNRKNSSIQRNTSPLPNDEASGITTDLLVVVSTAAAKGQPRSIVRRMESAVLTRRGCLTRIRSDETQLDQTPDRLVAGRDPQLAVDRDGLALDGVAREEECLPDLGHGHPGGQQ